MAKVSKTIQQWDGKWQGKTTACKIISQMLNPTDKDSQDIVAWLSPLNFFTKQNDVFSRRQEGTGKWLLEADTFKKWLDGTDRTLWCPGLRMIVPLQRL
jgi:hypothetical protein